jgi:hypothetical protein
MCCMTAVSGMYRWTKGDMFRAITRERESIAGAARDGRVSGYKLPDSKIMKSRLWNEKKGQNMMSLECEWM